MLVETKVRERPSRCLGDAKDASKHRPVVRNIKFVEIFVVSRTFQKEMENSQ